MRKLMQINENKLIGIIKNMLLEQSPEELAAQYGRDVNLNLLPNYATAEQPAEQPAQQPAAAVQQPAAVQPAQQSANYCPYGYQKVAQGPYFICSESEKIKQLQTALKLPADGKFGINTLQAVYKQFKKLAVTDDEISGLVNKTNKGGTAGVANPAGTQQNNLLSTGGLVKNLNRDIGNLGYINNVYSRNNKIILTNKKGEEIWETDCKALSTIPQKFKDLKTDSIGYVATINDAQDSDTVNLINNFFCKNTKRLDVTKAINDDLINPSIGLVKTYGKPKINLGNRFIAEKNGNNIWIKNQGGTTLFYSACGDNFDNSFFKINVDYNDKLKTNTTIKLRFTKKAVERFCTAKK